MCRQEQVGVILKPSESGVARVAQAPSNALPARPCAWAACMVMVDGKHAVSPRRRLGAADFAASRDQSCICLRIQAVVVRLAVVGLAQSSGPWRSIAREGITSSVSGVWSTLLEHRGVAMGVPPLVVLPAPSSNDPGLFLAAVDGTGGHRRASRSRSRRHRDGRGRRVYLRVR